MSLDGGFSRVPRGSRSPRRPAAEAATSEAADDTLPTDNAVLSGKIPKAISTFSEIPSRSGMAGCSRRDGNVQPVWSGLDVGSAGDDRSRNSGRPETVDILNLGRGNGLERRAVAACAPMQRERPSDREAALGSDASPVGQKARAVTEEEMCYGPGDCESTPEQARATVARTSVPEPLAGAPAGQPQGMAGTSGTIATPVGESEGLPESKAPRFCGSRTMEEPVRTAA